MSNAEWTDMVRYGRASTDKQDASLGEQATWAREKAIQEKIRIVAEFEDDGIAGDEISRRTGLQELFAFCEAEQRAGRPIHGVIIWDRDRLSRADSIKTAVIIDRLREAGLSKLYSSEGWEDLNDEIAMTMQHIKQDFTRRGYSKSLSKNVARSCMQRAQRGEWCGGPAPYGYVIGGDKHLATNEADGAVRPTALARMFHDYLGHDTSLGELAKQMNARGVPSPGRPARKARADMPGWTAGSVYSILTNPVYTGDLYYGRNSWGKYHQVSAAGVASGKPRRSKTGRIAARKQPHECHIVCAAAHPALVNRQTFDAVQRKLRSNRPAMQAGTTRRTFCWVFGGLLRCGQCGEVMWGVKPRGERPRGYCCSTYQRFGRDRCSFNFVSEEQLLVLVATAIRDQFADPQIAEQIKEEIRRQQRAANMEGEDLLPRLRQRRAELKGLIDGANARLARIPDDLIEGVIAEIRNLKDRHAEVVGEIATAEAAKQTGRELADLAEAGMDRLRHLPETVTKGDSTLLREVMRLIVSEIRLTFAPKPRGRNFPPCREGLQPRRRHRLTNGTIVITSLANIFGMSPVMFSNVQSGKPLSTLLNSGHAFCFSAV